MFEDKNIILASGSPRRKQLLQQAEIGFAVKTEPVAENFPPDMEPEKVPVFLAEKKAKAVKSKCADDALILAADTVVILDDKVIGKPAGREEAIRILTALAGKAHKVITGVCLMRGNEKKVFSVCTKVYFRKLSQVQIIHYVDTFQPMDKAGAYAIQEWIGLTGVEKIEGDYFNVVGLPVGMVIEGIAGF